MTMPGAHGHGRPCVHHQCFFPRRNRTTTIPGPLEGYVDGYVKHGHQRHGLGNVLFMINAALACGAEAILVNTSNVLRGTANAFGRRRRTDLFGTHSVGADNAEPWGGTVVIGGSRDGAHQ